MQQNSLEYISPETKLTVLGVSLEIVADKVTRLQNSPDLATLRNNVRETGLNVPQFLSLLFKNLYQQIQVRQRVAEKLKEFNLTPEMLDYLFINSAGEPFILFFSKYENVVPEEKFNEFKQAVNDVMLQELRRYLF